MSHRPSLSPLLGRFRRTLLAALLSAIVAPVFAADDDSVDVTEIPFEQLLQTDIITADKLARQISDAASAVSIVTAQDIKAYGYRTLGDILNSMRGLYMSASPAYGFLGGRGFGTADYAGRITLLIDGYRAPDNLYGQSYFGEDGLLDVDLIERVEYIPGSGSSSYGDSAFLGVINIVTRKGASFGGTQLSQEFGSHNSHRSRVTFGKQFESGLDLLLSTSTYGSDGRFIDSTPSDSYNGRLENETNHRYFVKATYRGWRFEGAWADRPNASPPDLNIGTQRDAGAYASLKYDGDLSDKLKTSTHVYWGEYRYQRLWLITDPLIAMDWVWDYDYGFWWRNDEYELNNIGRWWGVDSKLVGTWFDRHTLVVGAEFRDDYQQDRYARRGYHPCDDAGYNCDTSVAPVNDVRATGTSRRTTSIYGYDDIRLRDDLQLTVGERIDSRNNGTTTYSPRAALIYTPTPATTLKLSMGTAYRQPTWNDGYSANDLPDFAGNLPIERVQTRELVWEQQLGERTRLIGSLYRSYIDNRLEWNPDRTPLTGGTLTAKGAEVEVERLWGNGVRLRASYARQEVRDGDGNVPYNSPRHNAKLNLSVPLLGEQLRVGLAARYLGRRLNSLGDWEPGGVVGDLTLTGHWQNWSASLSARNVGNASFNDSGSYQVAYPIDRRNYWLQLTYDLK